MNKRNKELIASKVKQANENRTRNRNTRTRNSNIIYGVERYLRSTQQRILRVDNTTVLVKTYVFYSNEPLTSYKQVGSTQEYFNKLLSDENMCYTVI